MPIFYTINQGLKRCLAMVRKSARDKTVLQDVNDYVEALQMGVSNSFDDNGLTPVPAKVQEAVQSSAALRVTANRAQGAIPHLLSCRTVRLRLSHLP